MTTKIADGVHTAKLPQYTEFEDLFAQLGLPNTEKDIQDFICKNRPLCGDVLLVDAPFFTENQADFIREKRGEDSPTWTIIIDKLNALLREEDLPGCDKYQAAKASPNNTLLL